MSDRQTAEGPAEQPDPPVYDERGNVRPRGTPGAVPMTYAERLRIAKRIAKGEQIVTATETADTTEPTEEP